MYAETEKNTDNAHLCATSLKPREIYWR